MAEAPKRPVDVSRAEASRVAHSVKPTAPSNETARAADSTPAAVGPFTVLPTQFGRYRIEKLLGKGAMGAVYLAHDIQLDRLVALKVARVSAAGSTKLIQRMEIEAKAAAKIDHPLICKVFDFGEIDGIRFIAMQYIEGEDLKAYLKRVGRKREPAEALGLILQIARALTAAHKKNVIHRDLKPENVMLNENGEPVIMDFGLARRTSVANNAGLTQGMVLGTAAYMSPEQAAGRAEGIDHRSDLYALGVMLFEMLTGEWPFTGNAMEVMGQKSVLEAPSVVSLNPNLPPQLAAVCDKLIAKKKEDRYATCAELVAALEAVDLTAPVALEMEVEFEAAPPSLDFLKETPAAPAWLKPTKVGPQERKPSALLRPLQLVANWWRDQPPAMRWTLLGCAGAVVMLLAAILFFRSGDALVRVEVHADDVAVTFQNKTLTLADGTHEFQVNPGVQTLHITSGDVEFDTDKFTLKRGNNPAVTVEFVKSEIVTKLGTKEIGRRSLSVSSTNQPTTVKGTVGSDGAGWHGWPTDAPAPAIAPFDAAQAKQHQNAWAAYLKVPVEYTNSIGMKFRLVPPGEFLMGSTPAEIESLIVTPDAGRKSGWVNDESRERYNKGLRNQEPLHKVVLTKPMYLGINEVTQAEYEKVMGKNPSHFSPAGTGKGAVTGRDTPSHPVEMVSWNDAADFCAKLTLREKLKPFYFREGEAITSLAGTGYRLPTEAEWEYACRAGTTTAFWIDGDEDNLVKAGWANWLRTNAGLRTHSVGKLQMNPFGLFDVHGNVFEFVQDWYEPSYYNEFATSPAIDPVCTSSAGSLRGSRGGCWSNFAPGCQSATRGAISPTDRNSDAGFRVALPVNAAKVERIMAAVPAIGAPQPPSVEASISPAAVSAKTVDQSNSSSSNPKIPADAFAFQKKRFKLFTEQLTWHDAQKKCRQMGGRLAEVRSKEENDFLFNSVLGKGSDSIWLGASDEAKVGNWVWSDGSALTYMNWAKNQPNNYGGEEHYLEMLVRRENGQWNDQKKIGGLGHPNDWKTGYVCEWDASSTSEAADHPAPARAAAAVVTPSGPLTKGEFAKPTGNETVSFVKDIAPTMVNICGRCHNDNQKRGGLSMVTFEKLMNGGKSGRVIVPGRLDSSRLWRLVNGDEQPVMPAGSEAGITRTFYNNLKTWIEEGAKFDGGDVKKPLQKFVPTIKKQ